jgi:mannose-6-phosphate isomerase
VIELSGPIRPYAWGSRSFLAQLHGRDVPSPTPEAELWLGAHPDAPALVADVPLGELIAAEPDDALGEATLARFGPRLPYLVKILAADAPLSIQVHPDDAAARAGYERQAGDVRTYADPYAKPELLVALTPFEGLCGFRDPDETAGELAGLGVPSLAPVVSALRRGSTEDRLRPALALLLSWPEADRAGLITDVAASGQPLAVRLAAQYPGDLGVVVALMLNHVRLAPGEALFMPPGNVHAYLRGAGLEIMGASDNVVRAGLTPKHVDSSELMRLVRYEVLADPVFPATPLGPGLTAWSPPVAEFRLTRARSTPGSATVTLPDDGPRIVVCLGGEATLRATPVSTRGGGAGSAETLALTPGRAAFVAAGEPAVEVTGDTDVFQASVAAAA